MGEELVHMGVDAVVERLDARRAQRRIARRLARPPKTRQPYTIADEHWRVPGSAEKTFAAYAAALRLAWAQCMHNRKHLHMRMVAQAPRLTLFGHRIAADDSDSRICAPRDGVRLDAAAQAPLPNEAGRRAGRSAMAALAERVSLYRCIFSDLRLAYGSISGACDGMFEP